MDFGIARSIEARGITGTGVMIGTPEYMSPEQVEGKEVAPREHPENAWQVENPQQFLKVLHRLLVIKQ